MTKLFKVILLLFTMLTFLSLNACNESSNSTTPLTVSMSSPTNNATGVSTSQDILLKFSKQVTGVNTTTVTLHTGTISGALVAITLIPESNNVYKVKPNTTLLSNTVYVVAVGAGIKDTSGNLLTPTSFKFTTGNLFMMVGMGGIINNYNATTNTLANIEPAKLTLNSIAYNGNGKYVTVGEGGVISTSTDGVTWTDATSVPVVASTINSVTYGGNKFVAVARTSSNAASILTSTDGNTGAVEF